MSPGDISWGGGRNLVVMELAVCSLSWSFCPSGASVTSGLLCPLLRGHGLGLDL